MKSKWIVPMLAVLGLLVAVAAFAADAARKEPPDVQKKVVRIELDDDDSGGPWLWDEADDDLGLFALGGDDEEGDDFEGEDGDRRIVIRTRIGPMGEAGPGMPGMAWMHRRHPGGPGMGMGQGLGMGRGPGMHRGRGAAFARLDLTEAQRTKLADVRERQQRRAIQARADMQLARMDLHKLMKADAPNAAPINAQIDKLAKLRADMAKGRVGALLEARALLTPEQQKQLREGARGGHIRRMMQHGDPQDGEGKAD